MFGNLLVLQDLEFWVCENYMHRMSWSDLIKNSWLVIFVTDNCLISLEINIG